MLGKLLKYEIKATSRLFIPLYIALLVFASFSKFMDSLTFISNSHNPFIKLPYIITLIAYFSLMVGIIVITLFVIIQRFYKNLLTDEGYLMFTLPVKSWEHISNKLIISVMWVISSLVVVALSIYIFALGSGLPIEISSGLEELKNITNLPLGLLSFEVFILSIISLISGILLIYCAIALGQLFNKHKLLASLGMYIGIRTAIRILLTIIGLLFSKPIELLSTHSIPTNKDIQIIFLIVFIVNVIGSIGYFIATQYLLNKKLNLE